MNRTLSEITHTEGNIASGKCTGCGQIFTTSPVLQAAGENTEWEVVGAFGGHECAPPNFPVRKPQQRSVPEHDLTYRIAD